MRREVKEEGREGRVHRDKAEWRKATARAKSGPNLGTGRPNCRRPSCTR